MTRDEALQALRAGKICSDCKGRIWRWTPTTSIPEYQCNTSWICDVYKMVDIVSKDLDAGWQIIKPKIKKTFYQPVEMLDGQPFNTYLLYDSLEEAQQRYPKDEYPNFQFAKFELEVEE